MTEFAREFDPAKRDPDDPNPWTSLYVDTSIPMDDRAKGLMLRDMQTMSRRCLLPFVRPLAGLAIILIAAIRVVIPTSFSSSKLLHKLIYRGLKIFVSPAANELILRHFHLGTEILAFIKSNVPGAEDVETVALRPTKLEDLIDDVFRRHDLNLFNFVIQLNEVIHERGFDIQPGDPVNFDAITDGDFGIEPMPTGKLNFIDLQTAVESYTPIYQLLQSDNDFWRASNSLQLDETVGIYVAKVLGNADHLVLVNNRHPMISLSTLRAGFRLMLHGLAVEQLHFHLRLLKREQQKQQAVQQQS